MNQFASAFTLFMSLLVEAFPFLLIGVFFSSALLFFVDERRLARIMPKNPFLGAITGSLFGFLFPACECGNVPVARRLLMQGVPSPVAIGFLLAAPTVNPIVVWATWTAFRDQPEIVVLRVVCSLIIAITLACVFSVQTDVRGLLQPSVAQAIPQPVSGDAGITLLQGGTFMLGSAVPFETTAYQSLLAADPVLPSGTLDRLRLFLDNTFQELRDLGGVLVLGSAIAACIQVFVPRELILNLGQDAVTSVVAMMTLAAVVSICSTVDSFFALSFAGTFTSGSLLAFLVYGPMIDLKAIGMLLSVFKPRVIFYMFILISQLTFLAALVVNFNWS
ncbi:permease [Prochlorothrix hollandica]|uniref:Permease n=1 Tax=Prochlorothrix hollandica PCC 9006 = CALU 1027 TaxID=317619 RepID=A0A0M2PW83_PROHO|nr:permease [Prochlorothrix hollandica]KKI98636.1 permease [Prochlorothrix hollandica PCC 9006 = CALU 1027]